VKRLPDPELAAVLQARRDTLAESAPRTAAALAADAALEADADRVLVASDFVARALAKDDALLPGLIADRSLSLARSDADYRALLDGITPAGTEPQNELAFMADLRKLRRREMVRIAWRDLAGSASVESTLRETSAFAEEAIRAATIYAARRLTVRHGAPYPDADAGFVVLAMGKLGGGELNFSSDVDLVFLFPEAGETQGPSPLAFEEFYARQGRLVIRFLDAQTEAGFVHRVDMRLRPFGDSGPLVASFAALEDYLQSHGRDWERYAYVKARLLTGQAHASDVFDEILTPFVYRRYLDFGVFDALREMKSLIARNVERRELAQDLKLGPGGIREIEFIVQAFQLIRGGQDRNLREPSLLTVLPRLNGAKLLPESAVTPLSAAYLFLRRLENHVQELDDQQVHALPEEPVALARLAFSMGYSAIGELREALAQHRATVTRHFGEVVLAPAGASGDAAPRLAPLLDAELDAALCRDRLGALGVEDVEEVLRLTRELLTGARLRRLDELGRKRLLALLERLLAELPDDDALAVLRRLFSILEAIGQRSAYFALLNENAAARRRLIETCAYGQFLASQLAAHPVLLDELIDERVFEELPDRASLAAELEARSSEVQHEDPERQVEALVSVKQAAVFRVALADLSGRLPLMKVSDRLTEIAELIIEHAMRLAWQQIVARHGEPRCEPPGEAPRTVRVAAVGYGKLGGRELGYSSDLDLVFLHDSEGERQETAGPAVVDNQVFFLRYAQRLVHLLTMHSAAGRLYEVDVRLRPSGKGGFLVTSVDAFRDYQFKEAWTWEHQALLHARAVAGDATLMARFEALRLTVLREAVRRATLQREIRDMRERMRRELSSSGPGQFDLKQDRGGMADIEFLAQYWALRWANDHPPVAWFSDTIRQLESVASADLVPQATVDQLVGAYQSYRSLSHHRSLESEPAIVGVDAVAVPREAVTRVWTAAMEQDGAV
jgi:glutamate-ammonia-ligase adenylyltransferase